MSEQNAKVPEKKVKTVAKKVNPATSGENAEIEKKTYYDIKRRVLGWEKNNYSSLAVLKTKNGFFKMFGHSAVIYVCQIAKRLELKAELSSDTDYVLVSDDPVYLFKDFEAFENRLKKLKIFRSSMEDGVVVFDLGYKVDASDLAMMQKENEIVRDRANKLVLPSEMFPSYRNALRILSCDIYEIVRKMNPTAKTFSGDGMLGICSHLSERFVEAANGHTDMMQYMKNAVKDLRRLNAKLLVAMDVRITEDAKIFHAMQDTDKTIRKAVAAIAKLEGKNAG